MGRTRLWAPVLAAVTAVTVLVTLDAQTQTPYRAGTDLVPVYTTVQDRDGRLVPDLRQEDFSITDEGKPQRITFFSNEVSPFSVVLLLDRSGSMMQHLGVIREAASAFVDQMLPADQARIGNIGTRITIAPAEFTSSHEILRDVLARPLGGGSSPIWLSVDMSITALYGQTGRRVVLILSDGHDEPSANHPRTPFKSVAERVRRTDVMVYAVGFGNAELQHDGKMRIEHADSKLRELAAVSGGGFFEITDTADLRRLFTRVAEELHHQYWLGFEPPKRDGKIHNIEVKVKRPGMTARARQSYLAPSGQ
jgi:Ca-activated chloride channel family protein